MAFHYMRFGPKKEEPIPPSDRSPDQDKDRRAA
jgi:hypothetical protein